jgi:hypothetical protein
MLIIYEDLVRLFSVNSRIRPFEFLESILWCVSRQPDSESFLFENSSSFLKRDISLIDDDSPENAKSQLLDLPNVKESFVKVKVFDDKKGNNKSYHSNRNKSRFDLNKENHKNNKDFNFGKSNNNFKFEEESSIKGDQGVHLKIPNKQENRNIVTYKSGFNKISLQVSPPVPMSHSNTQYNYSKDIPNQEQELIKKCVLNLVKFSIEDGEDLKQQVIRLALDSKRISVGKFYFLVLHQMRVNHHYSIDVLVNL